MNLIGKTSGRLTVIAQDGKDWRCTCACGKTCTVRGDNITSRRQLSCGCLKGPGNSMYSRPLAAEFWRKCVEITYDPCDRVRIDVLGIMACDFAHEAGYASHDYPTPDDIIFIIPRKFIEQNGSLFVCGVVVK